MIAITNVAPAPIAIRAKLTKAEAHLEPYAQNRSKPHQNPKSDPLLKK